MRRDFKKVLIDDIDIRNKVDEISKRINEDYKDQKLIAVCVLRGAIMFYADIFRRLTMDARMGFFDVCSYEETKSTGRIHVRYDLDVDVAGEDVLIIEDIVDTGYTMQFLIEMIRLKGAKSVKTCVLLDKRTNRKVNVPIDYKGFEIDGEFVVGYGLDYKEVYRNVGCVGVLSEGKY